jgi:hypothetical protein
MFPVTCFATFAAEFPILGRRTGRARCRLLSSTEGEFCAVPHRLIVEMEERELPSKNAQKSNQQLPGLLFQGGEMEAERASCRSLGLPGLFG